jgi:formate dehydrogenase major subunit
VFVPFCYHESAINKLTNAALAPSEKIPEFKYCAIRVLLGGAARRKAASAASKPCGT